MRLSLLAAATAIGLGFVAPASAQELLEEYTAFIGPADLVNSKGKRLTQPWQILRQDRANFHKFGKGDPGDEWDSFFGDVKNRDAMEKMLMGGTMTKSARAAIVNGGAVVQVQIWGQGGVGNYISVDVFR
ncbi:hypothetical protein M3484_11350 [Pseudomonas sp. GX19020]|uniref:hypothetical protein n=1 Tax=Pseudomonadota TaxID=1224 RepID=UPI0008997992|nr:MULTISPECIES: hypothetical protein [Pseudomonadota]MCL4067167.1 hypothetical protein [Pseudomonas sp. GX19020]SED29642.1 hypothetical protein SAMN05519105_3824 [Rhodobacter sp. 24-YEA-8]